MVELEGTDLVLVDDRLDNLVVLEAVVSQYLPASTVRTAQSAEQGLRLVDERPPDVVVADLQMPGISGVELCRRLKANPRMAHVPVILVTSHRADAELKAAGLDAGAADFITRPIDNVEFIARVRGVVRVKRTEEALRRSEADLQSALETRSDELRETERRLRWIAEGTRDVIFAYDLDGRLLYVNSAVEVLTGYTVAELRAEHFIDWVHPEDRSAMTARWKALFQGERFSDVEFRLVTKAGETKWCLSSWGPLFDDDGTRIGIRGLEKNITERKQLEEQLRQSQKMEAIGTLAGGIAHDFNNILGVIYGYTELTRLCLQPGSEAHENLGEVLTAAQRAKELVQQILAFSRKEAESKKPLALHLVAKESLKLLRASIPTTIEIRERIAADSGAVLGNPTRLHQMLMNLCTNAYQAMRETGGVLEVSLKPLEVDRRHAATLPGLFEGPYLCLMVHDTGPGMAPATMARIFEPFFTTKGSGEGTGMGLAVVHGVVKAHGGALRVESRLGEGTTFYVYLPRHLAAVAAPVDGPVTTRGGNEHVLFVDDEPALVALGQRTLEGLGYRVTTRTNSGDALDAFREDPESFDAVVTDQTMPGMTGANLAREMLTLRPEIPVIVCTGYSDTLDAEKAQALGIRALLMKPLDRNVLGSALREALDSKGPLSPTPPHPSPLPRGGEGARRPGARELRGIGELLLTSDSPSPRGRG